MAIISRLKTNVKKMPDSGGGPDPEVIARLKHEGTLKEYTSLDEGRKKRRERLEKPAYLLPEDHYRKRKRRTITMSKESHAIAKKVGNGNVSKGIERALEHWFDCPRTDRRRAKETK